MSERDLTQYFGTRVNMPVILPSADVLKDCRDGLTKRIANERYPDRKKRLKAIRKEIDNLISSL